MSMSSSYVKNSAHFVDRISDAPIHSNQMVILDVVSLFTKVPTDEILAVVLDKLAADPFLEECTCIPIDNLMEMLTFCVETTYPIPCSCGKIYKCETGRPLKVRLEEHRKAVVRGEIEKSGMADHIWKERGNHLPLWDKVEIIDRAEHWRIRHLKESAHILGYNDLLSRPSIDLNTIWEPIIKKSK